MPRSPQSFENHTKIVPPYHVFLLLFLLVNLLYSIWRTIRQPSIETGFAILLALALVVVGWYLRIWPLKVQDRLIRLEERLRLRELLPEDLRGRLGELTVRQLVGLRFASDDEVAGLVREVLEEGLTEKAIKQRIKSWRADHQRV